MMLVVWAAAAAPPVDAALLMRRHVVRDAASRFALCGDGTPAVYYVRRCNSTYYKDESCWGITQKWVVAFESGSGLCYDAASCAVRAAASPSSVSSRGANATRVVDGILLSAPETNPNFYKATGVFVPSCSSDEWGANVSASEAATPGATLRHFRGRAIARAVLEDLLLLPPFGANASRTFAHADEVLLIGPAALAAQFDDLVATAVPRTVGSASFLCDGCGALDLAPRVPVAQQPCTSSDDCPPLVALRRAFAFWDALHAARAGSAPPPPPFAGCATAASDAAACLALPQLLASAGARGRARLLIHAPQYSSLALQQLRAWPVASTATRRFALGYASALRRALAVAPHAFSAACDSPTFGALSHRGTYYVKTNGEMFTGSLAVAISEWLSMTWSGNFTDACGGFDCNELKCGAALEQPLAHRSESHSVV